MKTFSARTALAALAAAISLGGCVPVAPVGTGAAPTQPLAAPTPTFNVTTHTFSLETVRSTFDPGRYQPGTTRVCLSNQRNGPRTIDLQVPNVNPLATTGPNQQICAFIPTGTVTMRAFTGPNPAQIAPASLSLAPYDGGLLTLIWQ